MRIETETVVYYRISNFLPVEHVRNPGIVSVPYTFVPSEPFSYLQSRKILTLDQISPKREKSASQYFPQFYLYRCIAGAAKVSR